MLGKRRWVQSFRFRKFSTEETRLFADMGFHDALESFKQQDPAASGGKELVRGPHSTKASHCGLN